MNLLLRCDQWKTAWLINKLSRNERLVKIESNLFLPISEAFETHTAERRYACLVSALLISFGEPET